jgi:hypothetical protein
MKTERGGTFFCRSGNKYINSKNKCENKYRRKYIWTKYGVETDEKQMTPETSDPLNHARKLKKLK